MPTDAEFLTDFEAQRWPLDRWHHRDHIRLAFLYLTSFTFDVALDKIRAGIRAHNSAHGIANTPTSGYHETMTVAWLRLVEMVLREYGPSGDGEAFCQDHPELLEKKTLRLFYSRARFMSIEAKSRFVEPDLTPLPTSARASPGPTATI
jgi:hypothetical protein